MGRNIRFRAGEVDLVARDPRTGAHWVIEVRGRKSSQYETGWWISFAKVQKLKKLVQLMTIKTKLSYRILFLQIAVVDSKKDPEQIEMTIKEFEIQD